MTERVDLSAWTWAWKWPGKPPRCCPGGRTMPSRCTVMPSTPSSCSTLLGSTWGLRGERGVPPITLPCTGCPGGGGGGGGGGSGSGGGRAKLLFQ